MKSREAKLKDAILGRLKDNSLFKRNLESTVFRLTTFLNNPYSDVVKGYQDMWVILDDIGNDAYIKVVNENIEDPSLPSGQYSDNREYEITSRGVSFLTNGGYKRKYILDRRNKWKDIVLGLFLVSNGIATLIIALSGLFFSRESTVIAKAALAIQDSSFQLQKKGEPTKVVIIPQQSQDSSRMGSSKRDSTSDTTKIERNRNFFRKKLKEKPPKFL
ncbi:hypothetical protein [Tellurirhabdus rosea]|uniref:hypothetical protein n=1 Tax=Tellurirhabdus rosea TaxID=2674997 RepID=UPI00225501C9|nr:hypothetical protein [Tellurirhabdus rosea]